MKIPIIPTAKSRQNQAYDLTAAQNFKGGSAVLLTGAQEASECAADPALILGFSAGPTHDLRGLIADPEAPKVIIHKAGEGQKFWGDFSVAPLKSDIGVSYGITRDADGFWYVDKTKTAGTARVYIHQVDTDTNRVEFSVLIANRQVVSS